MDFSNAVDLVGTDHTQVTHANLACTALFDDGQLGLDGIVAWPLGFNHIFQEATVDFINDFEVTRQYALEQVHGPLFQRFRQQGVVGVGEYLVADSPSGIPLQLFFVDQDTHQFRDGDGRVSIVQLNSDLIGKLAEVITMHALVTTQDVLQ